MKRTFISIALILCIFCGLFLTSCAKNQQGGSSASTSVKTSNVASSNTSSQSPTSETTSATVKSISVTKLPKTEYETGDALDLSGGEITATYSDDTTKTVSLTDPSVTVQRPNMNTAGEKRVSVIYNSKSTTFIVTITEPKLNVTFDLNYAGSVNETVKITNGDIVSAIADPDRAGHAFLGWFISADGNTKFNFDSAITADTVVYAHWGFIVKFDLNYDGSAVTEAVVPEGEKVSVPANNPEREGFIFTGWYASSACAEEFDFDTAITEETTVYAGWQEIAEDVNVYKVTFIYNDGTTFSAVKDVIEGEKVEELSLNAPEGAVASLEGWFTDESLTSAYDFDAAVTGDIELYAKWNVTNYSVAFHYNHENNNGIFIIESIRANQPAYNPAPANELTGYYDGITLDGYYFGGWYKDADCSDKVNFNDRINAFTHYYAKWLKVYEFQAEYTDFGEREAFGYSANGTGAAAFINKNNAELWGAHNGYWVANLHHQGLFVEFEIESDREVFDAALVLRLSADFYDILLNNENFEIKVNNEVIDYSFEADIYGAVAPDEGGIQNKRPFDNWDFGINIHLVEGKNTIRFTMLDEVRYGEVGTMYATAPMFDSIYVNTNATLTWEPLLSNV